MPPSPRPSRATQPLTCAANATSVAEQRSGSVSSASTLAGAASPTPSPRASARSVHTGSGGGKPATSRTRQRTQQSSYARATSRAEADASSAHSSSSSTATSTNSGDVQTHLPKPLAPSHDPAAISGTHGGGDEQPAHTLPNPHGSGHAHDQQHAPQATHAKRRERALRRYLLIVLRTPPSFFTITMGTGISSILLHNFPFPGRWLEYLGTIVFVLNVVIFVLLLTATVARFVFWEGVWCVMSRYTMTGFFWGTLPMGFATIINMICFVCVEAWGKAWAYIALAFWWADVVVAVSITVGTLFMLFTHRPQSWKNFAPVWLIPIVACVVAAASGAIVAEALMEYNAHLARGMLVVAYIIWGVGVPLAMMVMAQVVLRFGTGGAPTGAALPSVFIPLGPCGQAAFGIVTMGIAARRLAFEHDTAIIPGLSPEQARLMGSIMYVGGLITGLVLWGLSLAWYFIANAMFWDSVRKDIHQLGFDNFTQGQWALTFPIGLFGMASIAIAKELKSTAFKVIAAFVAVQAILHWLYVGTVCLWTLVRGELFPAIEVNTGASDAVVTRHWHRAVAEFEAGYGDPEAAEAADAAAQTEQAERAESGDGDVPRDEEP